MVEEKVFYVVWCLVLPLGLYLLIPISSLAVSPEFKHKTKALHFPFCFRLLV